MSTSLQLPDEHVMEVCVALDGRELRIVDALFGMQGVRSGSGGGGSGRVQIELARRPIC